MADFDLHRKLLPFLQTTSLPTSSPETGNQYPLLQLGLAGAILPSTREANVPTAYLQYLFYDQADSLISSGLQQVTNEAGTSWQPLGLF